MQKPKFTALTSRAVPLAVENIDTDQIIPARFLKLTSKSGYADCLFYDWRFAPDGAKKNFVLNDSKYSGQILIAGKNFGCGSSREHAAWAVYEYGFRVVISSFFADIFKNNAMNNSLVPVVVSQHWLEKLLTQVQQYPETLISINLFDQRIDCEDIGMHESFDFNPYKKECIINGYDDIDYLLSHQNKTIEFEKSQTYPHE